MEIFSSWKIFIFRVFAAKHKDARFQTKLQKGTVTSSLAVQNIPNKSITSGAMPKISENVGNPYIFHSKVERGCSSCRNLLAR